ncbi:hypothetical protein J4H86_04105 [Spiractinospora alimapuensis]|uniref:hypothetical protein n=1 Tax=Spiractinospora alimapuensis TaxID=2820884 RepID=UPI001F28CE48|nr:hypothetical protein [Spiractinospora alimapuensis]QVQ53001.1 hypothetical protein J4H86_04105 [Spiractinospora alimapuensis]
MIEILVPLTSSALFAAAGVVGLVVADRCAPHRRVFTIVGSILMIVYAASSPWLVTVVAGAVDPWLWTAYDIVHTAVLVLALLLLAVAALRRDPPTTGARPATGTHQAAPRFRNGV